MALVTADDVKGIIEVAADVNVQPFIDDADIIVTELLGDKGLSDERLAIIEKYLAAHFAALFTERGGLVKTRTGDSEDWMANNFDQGLSLTRYGQQALQMDTTGTLRSQLTKKNTARFTVV